jgi:hypothetical protein
MSRSALVSHPMARRPCRLWGSSVLHRQRTRTRQPSFQASPRVWTDMGTDSEHPTGEPSREVCCGATVEEAMNWQWRGAYTGTNSGTLVINLDDAGDHYEGELFAIDNDPKLPAVNGYLGSVPKGGSKSSSRILPTHVDRDTGNPISPEALATRYPGVTVPTHADTELTPAPNQLLVNWTTDIGTNGADCLLHSEADKPTALTALPGITTWSEFKEYARRLEPLVNWTTDIGTNGADCLLHSEADKPTALTALPGITTWSEFKEYARRLEPYRHMFRGQESSTWKLRASFHRTGRA